MAVDSSKLLDRDIGISKGAHISAPQVKMLKVVNVKLKDVSGNLKDNLVLSKTRSALKKRRLEEERRRKREKELEGRNKKGGGLKLPGTGFVSNVMDGILKVLLGMVVVKALDWLKNPAVMKFIKWAAVVGKVILDVAGWVLVGFVNLVDWGYKLYDGAAEWIKNNVGEEALEKFKTFTGNLKNLINGFFVWKLLGEKIFKSIVSQAKFLFNAIRTIIRTAFNIARNALKQGARFLNWVTRGRAGNLAKNILGKGKGFLRGAGVGARRFMGRGGRQLLKRGGNIFRGGTSIMKRGAGKVLKRGALKLFGKTFVKTAGKIFGRIPIIGPLIVGIVSLMSGEPLGQALFKTFGAAIGGMLGTFIPVPVLGTLLGEAVGVFVGDLLYHLIIKRDPKAALKLFGDTMKGIFNAGKAVVNWIFGGGLFNLLKQGGSMLMRFGKWIFFEAIPWAAKKIGGIGKIIGEWLGAGMTRWVDTFPSFEVPNVGIQDLLYKIMDATWPKWVTDINVLGWKPFGNLEGEPIFAWIAGQRPEWLEGLPRLPRVLGWMWQGLPLLKNLVDDNGEVKRIPKIWNLFNPMFMIPHTKNALFPGVAGGSTGGDSNGGGSSIGSSTPKDAASDVSESASYESGEGTEVIVPISIPKPSTPVISKSESGGASLTIAGGRGSDPTSVLYMGK